MTLEALREKIGDHAFFRLLRDWAHAEPLRQRDDARSSSRSPSSERHATSTHFFDVWIYQDAKPTVW